jgi:hypothetical protein
MLLHGIHDHRAAAGLVQGFRVPLTDRPAIAHRLARDGPRSAGRSVEINVWDTTADTRYMVLPVQPPETVGYPFPDAAAHNLHAQDEPTYDVRFRTEDLWPQAADKASVHVGVFESYLEKAL